MTAIQFLLRYGYAPAFFLGFFCSAITLVEAGLSLVWLLPLLLSAVGLSFMAEQILPYEKLWNRSKADAGRDWIHAVVNESTNFLAIALIPLLSSIVPGFGLWPNDWPLWAQLVMTIVIADFGITMAHYASHQVDLLWRMHAVHHSVTRMYGFNGLMKHPLHQIVELTAGTIPLLLMGMPLEIGALLGFMAGVQLLLQHSNVDMRVGVLIYIWAVAPGHRHHHIASSTEGDVNFGLFTMIWDHVLGTFVCDRPQPRDGALGVAGRPDFPQEYSRQIIEPFRRDNRQLL